MNLGMARLADLSQPIRDVLAKTEPGGVAQPFQSAAGKLLYEGQGGLVTPGEGQIPGSASDWQTVQSFLSVRNAAEWKAVLDAHYS